MQPDAMDMRPWPWDSSAEIMSRTSGHVTLVSPAKAGRLLLAVSSLIATPSKAGSSVSAHVEGAAFSSSSSSSSDSVMPTWSSSSVVGKRAVVGGQRRMADAGPAFVAACRLASKSPPSMVFSWLGLSTGHMPGGGGGRLREGSIVLKTELTLAKVN